MDNPCAKALGAKIRIYQYGSFLSNHECLSPISYTPLQNQETQIDMQDNFNSASFINVKVSLLHLTHLFLLLEKLSTVGSLKFLQFINGILKFFRLLMVPSYH